MDAATYLQELFLKALVRLLKESQEDSHCHPIEAHPQLLPGVLSLKEVEENVHRGRMAKMVAEDREGLQKGPTIGMQLGRGHVDLCKKSTLETREGKAESEPLEDGGVHEEERFFRIRTIVHTHRNAFPTRKSL